MKVFLHSLGCPKNLVDSEIMLGLLKRAGYKVLDTLGTADLAIVNTCAFIKEAEEESLEKIEELLLCKQAGRVKTLLVAGCLSQRYGRLLKRRLPGVDGFLGTGDFHKIVDLARRTLRGEKVLEVSKPNIHNSSGLPRHLITPSHYAYLRIAEGCNNCCSYCVVPGLRGSHQSRPLKSLIKEAKELCRRGVKELNLISQDTTYYGMDIYPSTTFRKSGGGLLPSLLKQLAKIHPAGWLRLLYTHPAHVSEELISVIRDTKPVCKYIDLPLQHINDEILRRMKRKVTKRHLVELITALRKNIPGLAIRTSFIVGFPGETDKQFKELLDFIKEVEFERLGAFIYSPEAGTPAAKMKQIHLKVKEERLEELMKVQRGVAGRLNQRLLGKEIEVLIDEKGEKEGFFLGRSQSDAPEVDGLVRVKSSRAKVGDFLKVKVTQTYEYDLVAEG